MTTEQIVALTIIILLVSGIVGIVVLTIYYIRHEQLRKDKRDQMLRYLFGWWVESVDVVSENSPARD